VAIFVPIGGQTTGFGGQNEMSLALLRLRPRGLSCLMTCWRCFPPAPAVIKSPSHAIPAQHVRPSGFFCCWSDCLRPTAPRREGSGVFCGQLQTVIEDIYYGIFAVCSAH